MVGLNEILCVPTKSYCRKYPRCFDSFSLAQTPEPALSLLTLQFPKAGKWMTLAPASAALESPKPPRTNVELQRFF